MGVESRDVNGDGGARGYGTYVDDRGGKKEVSIPFDHGNHPTNNWYRTFMTSSSSSFVLLFVVVIGIGIGSGCVVINNFQLLSSLSSSTEEVGTASSVGNDNDYVDDDYDYDYDSNNDDNNLACPTSKHYFSFFIYDFGECTELYFEDEDTMKSDYHDKHLKGFRLGVLCKDQGYPSMHDEGGPIIGGSAACYARYY